MYQFIFRAYFVEFENKNVCHFFQKPFFLQNVLEDPPKKIFLMNLIDKDRVEQGHESTLLTCLSYLQQKSTYHTSIEPILFRLHKREITEKIGESLLFRELMDDPLGSSLLQSYLEECINSDFGMLKSLEVLEDTRSFATNFLACDDDEVLFQVMSNNRV